MSISNRKSPPIWFWVIGIMAVLWNGLGLYNFLIMNFFLAKFFSEISLQEKELFLQIPNWAMFAYGIAVVSGIIASFGLLVRKSWAKPLFYLSFFAAASQFYNWLVLQNTIEIYGAPAALTMPIIVLAIGILFIIFSTLAIQKGWIL